MRYFITTVALAVGAMAQPGVVPRDATIIKSLLSSVFDSMTNVDNEVLEYHGGAPLGLHKAGAELYNTIEAGIEAVGKIDCLTPEDVAEISDLAQEVSKIGAKFLGDLGGASKIFAANNLCCHAHEYSIKLGEVSNKFFLAAKEKYPPEAQEYAAKEIDATNARFAEAQAALAPEACVDELHPPQEGPGDHGHGHGHDGGEGEGEGDGKGKEPTETTSVAWQTATILPGEPSHGPEGEHKEGHGDVPFDKPPKPVVGSAGVLRSSGALMALGVAAALTL